VIVERFGHRNLIYTSEGLASIITSLTVAVNMVDNDASRALTVILRAGIFEETEGARMVDDVYAQVGAEIRRRRDGLGLSQAQLASRIGVGRTSITMIERGSQAILVHQLLEIARALRVAPDKLLATVEVDVTASPSRDSLESARLLELLSDLEPTGRITR
jgi:transcriptional regulator with XRE-family HTH domain